ncbi:MAG: DegT/DnrJ/EryC1/StrS family aminotransferase [Christensenellaceae bacterium]|nr:DegT/DnrJ/EryC1/StrS family aminotransferase [Christensenellaceae bacterium]
MQFRDLKAQYKALKLQMDKAISEVLSSSAYILGEQVSILEKRLAGYVGVKNCISCANGTDALILSLMALNVGKGDAVFAPNFTFFATVNCAMLIGASPVLVDIDKNTFNMSPEHLEQVILQTIKEGALKPKVIITVDLFGQCADYDAINEIAQKYNLLIVEDAAQGFGGSINGKKACAYGDIATTSFFPAKPLGCYGDGGAMFTNDDDLDAKLRSLRSQGRSNLDKYDNRDMGLNSRLDTLQAAILSVKLDAFIENELEDINKVADKYTSLLSHYVKTPFVPKGYVSSWAQYTILLKSQSERDALKELLKQNGIPSMVYYPRGMHQQTAIKKYGFDKGEFPNTEYVVDRCLSLPMHPYLSDDDIYKVANCIIDFFK